MIILVVTNIILNISRILDLNTEKIKNSQILKIAYKKMCGRDNDRLYHDQKSR